LGCEPSDHLSEKLVGALAAITNCLVLVVAEQVSFWLGLSILEQLAINNNQAVLQRLSGTSVCIPHEAMLQLHDGRTLPMVYWDTKNFVLSSRDIPNNQIPLLKQRLEMLEQRYIQSLCELRQAVSTRYPAQLFSLIYNLQLIDRA